MVDDIGRPMIMRSENSARAALSDSIKEKLGNPK